MRRHIGLIAFSFLWVGFTSFIHTLVIKQLESFAYVSAHIKPAAMIILWPSLHIHPAAWVLR